MEALVDPKNLLTALIAILTFATLVTLLGGFTGGGKLENRMKAVADRKEALRQRSRQQIAQQAQQGAADAPVVISADRSVKYEQVVKVMDVLQKGGVSRVGLSVILATP